jgi:hypothetical protein
LPRTARLSEVFDIQRLTGFPVVFHSSLGQCQNMTIEVKNRAGKSIVIDDTTVSVSTRWSFRTQTFKRSEISTIEIGRLMYDMPFVEESLIIYTKDGRKHIFGMIKKSKAREIMNVLIYNSPRDLEIPR